MCAAERSVTNLPVRIQRATFTCCVVSVSMGVLNVFIGGGGRAIKTWHGAAECLVPVSNCVIFVCGPLGGPRPPPPPPPPPHPTPPGGVYVRTCLCLRICARVHVCARVRMRIHVHVCSCTRWFVCSCARACMRVCAHA